MSVDPDVDGDELNLNGGEAESSPSDVVSDNFEADTPAGLNRYRNRYVLFIDILGFKALIAKSKKSELEEETVSNIVNVLSLKRSAISDQYYGSRKGVEVVSPDFHTFSDFIVGSVEQNPYGLDCLMFAAWSITEDLLSKGFTSRGGISKGKVAFQPSSEKSPGFIFGPAFNEAYLLENSIARYPRVVLSREVRKDFEDLIKNKPEFWGTHFVRKCEDGPSCIDLFAAFRSADFLAGVASPTTAKRLSENLIQNLDENDDDPRVYEKIRWLAECFVEATKRDHYAFAKSVEDYLKG